MVLLRPNFSHRPQADIHAQLSWESTPCGLQDAHYDMVQGKAAEARVTIRWRGSLGPRKDTHPEGLCYYPEVREAASAAMRKWLRCEHERTSYARNMEVLYASVDAGDLALVWDRASWAEAFPGAPNPF